MKKSFILSLATLCCAALLHAQINQSLNLNNSGYAVTNLSTFTSNQLTFEAWIKAESFGSAINAHTIISKEESAAVSGFAFHFGDGGKLGFTIANSGAWQTTQTTGNVIPLNTWTHVAVTYNGTACLLYVDGVAQTTSGSMSGSITTNTTALNIGYSLAGNRLLPGNIDDLRLYAAVRTPTI